ncbi:MAG: GIY-YIG nuclease family protein [Pseudomonadota bacterium]
MTRPTEGSDWSLYVLRCGDGSLYTGISPDVAARLEAHRAGRGSRYLRGRAPLVLVAEVSVGDRAAASRAEYRFKQLARRDKLRLLEQGLEAFIESAAAAA